ncbi:hypothetical protein D3C81_2161850 [compost metagenome]
MTFGYTTATLAGTEPVAMLARSGTMEKASLPRKISGYTSAFTPVVDSMAPLSPPASAKAENTVELTKRTSSTRPSSPS